MIDWKQDPKYPIWASTVLGFPVPIEAATWLTSLDTSGNVLGVVIFSKFTYARNCELTVASTSPRFLTKTFARAIAYYLFGQSKLRRVTAIICVDNERSLNLAARLGFKVEGVLRGWFPGDRDGLIHGLLVEDCQFAKATYARLPKPADSSRSGCNDPGAAAAE